MNKKSTGDIYVNPLEHGNIKTTWFSIVDSLINLGFTVEVKAVGFEERVHDSNSKTGRIPWKSKHVSEIRIHYYMDESEAGNGN